jgi:hypothetical protein
MIYCIVPARLLSDTIALSRGHSLDCRLTADWWPRLTKPMAKMEYPPHRLRHLIGQFLAQRWLRQPWQAPTAAPSIFGAVSLSSVISGRPGVIVSQPSQGRPYSALWYSIPKASTRTLGLSIPHTHGGGRALGLLLVLYSSAILNHFTRSVSGVWYFA